MNAFILQFWPYLAAAAVAGFALLKAYSVGKSSERVRQSQAEAKARDTADRLENEVRALSADEARRELGKWSRR